MATFHISLAGRVVEVATTTATPLIRALAATLGLSTAVALSHGNRMLGGGEEAPRTTRESPLLAHVQPPAPLRLEPSETRLFDLLRATCAARTPATVCRVAGGWVRDRLLNLVSHDIDIALSDMTGRDFAPLLAAELAAAGDKKALSGVAVIAANPAQSKHLETATLRVFGEPIDLVNLRGEDYAEGSRIPSAMRIGSPAEDAAVSF